jgi:hypothetical protein
VHRGQSAVDGQRTLAVLHRSIDPLGLPHELVPAPVGLRQRRVGEGVLRIRRHRALKRFDGTVDVLRAAVESLQVAAALDERLVRARDARPAGRQRPLGVGLQLHGEQPGRGADHQVLQRHVRPGGDVERARRQLHLLAGIDQVERQPNRRGPTLHRSGDREGGAEGLQALSRTGQPRASHLGCRDHAQRALEALELRQAAREGLDQAVGEDLILRVP